MIELLNLLNSITMFSLANILSITITLFVVIDIFGPVPIIIGIKRTAGDFKPLTITAFAGALMIVFLCSGKAFEFAWHPGEIICHCRIVCAAVARPGNDSRRHAFQK